MAWKVAIARKSCGTIVLRAAALDHRVDVHELGAPAVRLGPAR
ncbi:hypothetical protein [Streptosporangium vulgare]